MDSPSAGTLPVFLSPATSGTEPRQNKPSLVVQNDVLAMTYGIMERLRKWLQDGADDPPPTADSLLDHPKVEQLFSQVKRPLTEPDESASLPASIEPFDVLRRVLQSLVAEAWIARLRGALLSELEQSLSEFRRHLAQDRTKHDDWRDDIDGGVVLYDFFRPNLWKRYRTIWSKWSADMQHIRVLTTHLQQLGDAVNSPGGTP